MAKDRLIGYDWIPWETTPDSPATAPGVPGDAAEELVETVNELHRGENPWASRLGPNGREGVVMAAAVVVALWAAVRR